MGLTGRLLTMRVSSPHSAPWPLRLESASSVVVNLAISFFSQHPLRMWHPWPPDAPSGGGGWSVGEGAWRWRPEAQRLFMLSAAYMFRGWGQGHASGLASRQNATVYCTKRQYYVRAVSSVPDVGKRC